MIKNFDRVLGLINSICSIIGLILFVMEKDTQAMVFMIIVAVIIGPYIYITTNKFFMKKKHFCLGYDREISLFLDQYPKTMEKFLYTEPFISVMGINDNFDMENVGVASVHRSFKEYMFDEEEYKEFSNVVKKCVEKECNVSYGTTVEPYTCVTVPFETSRYRDTKTNVLFVVNSKIGKEGKKTMGYDIKSVIDTVFNELRENNWEIVLFPVISGRNVYPRNKSQYIKTIQLIVNKFLDLNEEGKGKHLVISLHSKSLKENGYNFEDICKLVEMCIHVDDPVH